VDAGPDRNEIMTRETMKEILIKIPSSPISTIDLTGGAPELNPEFRWFVCELRKFMKQIIVRCNLTIIVSNKKYHDLPDFFCDNEIEVVASLPYFSAGRTNAQRGEEVFEKSIQALRMLNEAGYGADNSNLKLNLVYNPTGAFLPGDQQGLEQEFKQRLLSEYGIVFNNLFTLTNLPISRFLEYLISSGNLESYMNKLVNAFNPASVGKLMCLNTLSVGWDGNLYDCDFNQILDLHLNNGTHIRDLNWTQLEGREIITNRHCFGCTAGAGSSCGGALT
jgi:radical SAM/Cys-rich protein